MTKNKLSRGLHLAGVAVVTMAQPAWAQEATTAAAAPNEGIADIVVTARRTEEGLQTTPVSVTAVSAVALERSQVENAKDLQRLAPNLNVATGSPSVSGYAFISLRGQSQVNPGAASDPAVGIYVDGVYVPRPSQGLFDFADLERVEILRGPQGTLFGRNTTGGALNIITKQPTGDLEGMARISYGNYDSVEANAVLNVPLAGEELAARIAYSFKRDDGYGHNDTIDRRTFDEAGNHFVRGKLRWAPKDSDWDVTLSGDYNYRRDHGQAMTLAGFNPAALAPIVAFFPSLSYLADLTPILSPYLHKKSNWYTSYGTVGPLGELPMNVLKAAGGGLTVNGRIGGVAVQSITGYRYSRTDSVVDLDGTPLRFAQNHTGFGSKQFSQELQLSGESGILKWIGGLYFSRETGDERSLFEGLGLLGTPPLLNDGDVLNISRGVYGQGYLQLAEGLRLAAGLRWTWDKRKVVLHNRTVYNDVSTCNVANPDDGTVPPCDQTESTNFDYPAWTVGIDYQLNEQVFVYAKTSGAAMAGGWNLRFGSIPAFSPEKVRDIEFGIKTDLLDRRLRLNVSVFKAWQSDVQRNINIVVGPSAITQYVVNAGKAHVEGVEFELAARPWHGMEVTGSLGLLDGAYKKGSFLDTQIIGGVPVVVDRSGEPLPQLAKVSANIGATQTINLGSATLDLHADYSYISSQIFSPLTAAPSLGDADAAVIDRQNALSRIPGYGLVNARVSLMLSNPAVEIALFSRNLFNNKHLTRTFTDLYSGPLATAVEFPGSPRTYGISVSYRFGS
jgi:iron complex outermembrane receptor protein